MKQVFSTVVFLALICTQILAQQREIVGRVLNKRTEKPIDSVKVVVVGSNVESMTNRFGFFKLSVDTAIHRLLNASRAGFATLESHSPQSLPSRGLCASKHGDV